MNEFADSGKIKKSSSKPGGLLSQNRTPAFSSLPSAPHISVSGLSPITLSSNGKKEEMLEDFMQLVFYHLDQMVPLLEKWIEDIKRSKDFAERLTPLLSDPDPSVRQATTHALTQMGVIF